MKTLVDTTVIANALLKAKAERGSAILAIKRFEESFAPVYAIKELKAGPLKNYIWFHNKLALFSYIDAIKALQRSSLSPRRYQTATALEALTAALEATGIPENLKEKSETKGITPESLYKEKLRLSLKKIIKRGWNNRRKITTHMLCELPCYPETPVTESRDLTLEVEPVACDTRFGCALAKLMCKDLDAIKALIKVVDAAEQKPENIRRARSLRRLLKPDSWKTFTNDECRALGDAAIAFLAPNDSVVLTTNTRDIQPLSSALNKKTETPQQK